MSYTLAIVLVFTATFLWSAWLQARKFTGDFPLEPFMVWLYFSSVIIVWLVIGIVGIIKPMSIWEHISQNIGRAAIVSLCGAGMAIGMYLQMAVIDKVGLILSNSVSATLGVILGVAITVGFGGLPEHITVGKIILCALTLICATFLCQISGRLRDKDLARKSKRPEKTQDTKAALLLILSSFLVACYPLGMTLGVKTAYTTNGFTSLECVGLLSFGSFIGIFVFCAIPMTHKHIWKSLVDPKYKKEIALSCLCGACHYGGNCLHVLSSATISTAVSWLLGRLGNAWTYIWGLVHKEYKGASKKTYVVLALGICIYALGIYLLANSFYR